MCMTVERGRNFEPIKRFLQPTAAKIGEDFERLPFDSRPDGRIVEQRDAVAGAQPLEGGFKLQRFVNCLTDVRLHRRFTERAERAAAEASAKALHPNDSDAPNLHGVTVQNDNANIMQDLADFNGVASFVVVVSQHRDGWNLVRGTGKLLRQNLCLRREAVVGQVAAEAEKIGRFGNL